MNNKSVSKRAKQEVAITEQDFNELVDLINQAHQKTYSAINKNLIDLYWNVGRIVSEKTVVEGWGKSTVKELSDYISVKQPEIKGFSAQNIWRMKQFFETYVHDEKLSTLLRELPWSHNIMIMSATKTDEAKEFYLRLAIENRYSFRELERQMNSMLFERWAIYDMKNKDIIAKKPELSVLRDNYTLEFLDLPEEHSEAQLEEAIMQNIEKFLMEFGHNFTFVGRQFRVQVGNSDFYIDLLLYHRKLQCFVAVELKTGKFEPRQFSQLDFYLEALDRDVKLEHENPSIGLYLCASKEEVLVDYTTTRSISPAMVAEYELNLPSKEVLTHKLKELRNIAEDGNTISHLPSVIGSPENSLSYKLAGLTPEVREVSQKIVDYIKENGSIESDATKEIEGKSLRSAQRLLSELVENDILIATGSTRNRLYRLKL